MTTGKKIRQTLFSNMGLKLIAVVISILIWLFVVNVENPATTQTYTAKVQITHGDTLTEQNKYYEVEGAQSVSFRVTAKRTVQQKLSNADFSAIADLNYLDDDGSVPITITARNYSSSVSISATPHYLKVKVGELKSSKFTVDTRTAGKPDSGFVVSEVTAEPSVISVEGPKSIVSTIETVTATANVEGISQNQEFSVVPKFYDKNGKAVDTSKLQLSVDTVLLRVSVTNSKSVNITTSTSGELQPGLELDSITVDPSSVVICGDAERLNSIAEITIPADIINLSAITEDWETTVDLSSYLPEGVTPADNEATQAKIKVTLKSSGSKTLDVPVSNLTINNLDSGLTASFTATSISVTVKGPRTDLANLTASSITGSVDASGLTAGKHAVAVELILDSGLTADDVSTELEVKSENEG